MTIHGRKDIPVKAHNSSQPGENIHKIDTDFTNTP